MEGDTARSGDEPIAVLVPVKAFTEAKARLAPVLGPRDRAALARELADRVIDAAASIRTAIVCDDEGVAAWARSRNAEVIWRPGRGLNGAVEDGVAHLGAAGVGRVIVSHADLPLIIDFAEVAGAGRDDEDGVVLVPDRHEDGTNVAVVPTGRGFRFGYGPGSFARHCEEADRLALGPTIIRSDRLSWDVDTADDLIMPDEPTAAPLDTLVRHAAG